MIEPESPPFFLRGSMKKLLRLVTVFSLIALFALASAARAETAEKPSSDSVMIAAGSGVNLGITRLLAEAFMKARPGVEIKVPGSIGSKGAITAMADGAITFGLISRPLKEKEKTPNVIALPYAQVPLIVAANAIVADDALSSQELVDIFRGKKTKWSDGHEIVVQTREPFDSGVLVFEEKISGFKEAYGESRDANRWSVYFTDQDANQALSTTRYAIGFTDLGMIATEKLAVKPLRLDGVMPSSQTLEDGSYTLSRPLFILYNEKTVPESGKAFLDFIRSKKGKEILKANGYQPLS